MMMNGLSSADLASASANDANRKAQDLQVLLSWALDRIAVLEAAAGITAAARPELPSEASRRRFREFYQAAQPR